MAAGLWELGSSLVWPSIPPEAKKKNPKQTEYASPQKKKIVQPL